MLLEYISQVCLWEKKEKKEKNDKKGQYAEFNNIRFVENVPFLKIVTKLTTSHAVYIRSLERVNRLVRERTTTTTWKQTQE